VSTPKVKKAKRPDAGGQLTFHTVTKERWKDLARLFGPRGACGGCWCMSWRLAKKEFDAGKGENNRRAMKKIVDSGQVPGILAYDGAEPVGWCSVAPRDVFPRLDNAPTLKRIDEVPVWSVVCFYIASGYRRSGVSVQLLKAAVEYVKTQGGQVVEGYPYELKKGASLPGAFLWTGTAASFRKAGFKVALRRSKNRPIMRYVIE
jgi:GNAT superfamily N-acetyltransferase